MNNEDLDKLMATVGPGGGGALAAMVASLTVIMKSVPNFDREKFKAEMSSLIEHPAATEIQKNFGLA